MEDNKYLQQFYYVLECPWEEQNPLTQIPNGWGKSVFSNITIDLSFNHILWQLIKGCNMDILERTIRVVEEMRAYSDIESRRLTPNEIYQALSSIKYYTALDLLSKIECTDGIYGELCDALAMKDSAKFVIALKDCNTKAMKSVANFILYLNKKEKLFELLKNRTDGALAIDSNGNAEDNEIQFSQLMDTLSLQQEELKYTTQRFRTNASFGFKRASEGLIKNKDGDLDNIDADIELDDWLCYSYFSYFFRFCKLRDSGVLRTRIRMSFEYLFRLPAVRGLYDEGMECWENNSWEEKLSEFESRLQDTTSDECKKGINEIEPPEPTSLPTPEPDQETITVDPNLTDRDYETFAYPLLQEQKKGRHRGKWYDTKYYNAAEDELGDSIKRDVWPLIHKRLGEFKYPDSVAGESKRTIVKNLGAALIYYAAQGTNPPIAKDWNAQGVKSSYERTFKRIEHVARNSVDAFMTMLKLYEEVEPLLESDQKNKAASKLLVLLKNYEDEQKKFILSHNLYEIKDLIEYLRDRLPAIFKPYFKDK